MGTIVNWLIRTFVVIFAIEIAVTWGGIFQSQPDRSGWKVFVAWALIWTALEIWHEMRNWRSIPITRRENASNAKG